MSLCFIFILNKAEINYKNYSKYKIQRIGHIIFIWSLLFESLEDFEFLEKLERLLALNPFESLLLLDLVIRPTSSYSSTNLLLYPSLSVSLGIIYDLNTLRSTNSSYGNFLVKIACLSS